MGGKTGRSPSKLILDPNLSLTVTTKALRVDELKHIFQSDVNIIDNEDSLLNVYMGDSPIFCPIGLKIFMGT